MWLLDCVGAVPIAVIVLALPFGVGEASFVSFRFYATSNDRVDARC